MTASFEDDCRETGERPVAAATCYTVKNAEGIKRHFTVDAGPATDHLGACELRHQP